MAPIRGCSLLIMEFQKIRPLEVPQVLLLFFMIRQGLLSSSAGTRFVSEQGTRMGRRSLLHVELRGENGTDGIYVGGHVTPIIEAVMNLPSRC